MFSSEKLTAPNNNADFSVKSRVFTDFQYSFKVFRPKRAN